MIGGSEALCKSSPKRVRKNYIGHSGMWLSEVSWASLLCHSKMLQADAENTDVRFSQGCAPIIEFPDE